MPQLVRQSALGDLVVYGLVRDQLGLRRARWCLHRRRVAGADTFRFFRAFGINLKQVYGSTEPGAFVSVQPDSRQTRTRSAAGPGIEVRIADSGEVLVRGGNVFSGYLKQEDATHEAIDAEGWFHTGDAGFIDPQGHLAIIDRAKDVGKLTDGTPFAPQFVENKLKFSPYIGEAVAFGDQQLVRGGDDLHRHDAQPANGPSRTACRTPATWTSPASRRWRASSSRRSPRSTPRCPQRPSVRRIVLLNKELDADDAEMTRTRKVRRAYVAEKYAPVITALYDGASETQLTMDITYEDGRKSQLTSTMLVHDIEPPGAAGRLAA